jgi:hypothetical protein
MTQVSICQSAIRSLPFVWRNGRTQVLDRLFLVEKPGFSPGIGNYRLRVEKPGF